MTRSEQHITQLIPADGWGLVTCDLLDDAPPECQSLVAWALVELIPCGQAVLGDAPLGSDDADAYDRHYPSRWPREVHGLVSTDLGPQLVDAEYDGRDQFEMLGYCRVAQFVAEDWAAGAERRRRQHQTQYQRASALLLEVVRRQPGISAADLFDALHTRHCSRFAAMRARDNHSPDVEERRSTDGRLVTYWPVSERVSAG